MELRMSWESLRDLCLITFASGALVAFGLSRILHRQLGSTNVALMATVWRCNDACWRVSRSNCNDDRVFRVRRELIMTTKAKIIDVFDRAYCGTDAGCYLGSDNRGRA
jgi:hypothetical protein